MEPEKKGKLKAYESARQLQEPQKVEKLLRCYDSIRKSAAMHDAGAVIEMIRLLENSLNYEASPVFSWRLQELYQHIRLCVESENFQEACRVADELHTIWQQGIAAHSTAGSS